MSDCWKSQCCSHPDFIPALSDANPADRQRGLCGISSNDNAHGTDEAALASHTKGVSGRSSSGDDENVVSHRLSLEEHRWQSRRKQMEAWQAEEQVYLKHPQWCEHRIIILLEEAFLASKKRQETALRMKRITPEDYAARVAGLKKSLVAIKAEYRRTLQRCRDSNAPVTDLASLASKAVSCVASVFPWSSDGFALSFDENLCYGQLLTATAAQQEAPKGGAPACAGECPLPCMTAAAPPVGAAPVVLTRTALPPSKCTNPARPLLQPLPPRRDGFTRTVASDGSVVLSSSLLSAQQSLLSPPPSIARYCNPAAKFASPLNTPGGPEKPLPLSVTGPIRPDEQRFIERKQLMQASSAFYARSLASVGFIGMRRSTTATLTTKSRLAAAKAAMPRTVEKDAVLHSMDSPAAKTLSPPSPGSLSSNSLLSAEGCSDSSESDSSRSRRMSSCDSFGGLSLDSPMALNLGSISPAQTPPGTAAETHSDCRVEARERRTPYVPGCRRWPMVSAQEQKVINSLW